MERSEHWEHLEPADLEQMSTAGLEKLLLQDFQDPESGEARMEQLYYAAQLLAEYCGREPQRMLTEVQKLAAHSPEGITPEDVRSLVAPVTEARVFDLPDKIIARNFTAAMAAINDLVFLRESPVSILSILSMAFVDLYRAGVARKAGIPDAEAKKALGYGGSGYRYDKGAQNQRKFSIPTLERILELLAEADKQMKTTGPDARVVLETTVAEIFREMEGA